MRSVWHAVIAAFSTFSVLPTPRIEWRADSLRGILCALPLVGAVIGGFGCLYYLIAGILSFPSALNAAVFTVLPIALSGGIHMDGFADTVDALGSHAEPEKKRAILKDPHTGAFAVIGVGCYLLLYFGLAAAAITGWRPVLLLGIAHVLSRAVGALAGTILPASGSRGMLAAFRDAQKGSGTWILLGWIAGSLAGTAALSPLAAVFFAAVSVIVFLYVRHTADREFGGMSGDLAGYCISLLEITLLLGLVLSERIGAL